MDTVGEALLLTMEAVEGALLVTMDAVEGALLLAMNTVGEALLVTMDTPVVGDLLPCMFVCPPVVLLLQSLPGVSLSFEKELHPVALSSDMLTLL